MRGGRGYNKDLIPFAKQMRTTMTRAEYLLWNNCLKRMPLRFRRQRPFGNYILDFYCAKVRLAIELDGMSHDLERQIQMDLKRTEFLNANGVTVLRFSNSEVFNNLDGVYAEIMKHMNTSPPDEGGSLSRGREAERRNRKA
ncbi:MAG: endonuclease domain-containing protein [Candidatus Pacebacteria bacterium]|nr:endonuclease domain-containing protein [Candidatus Paceibacterota bacterium]